MAVRMGYAAELLAGRVGGVLQGVWRRTAVYDGGDIPPVRLRSCE
jgi:hypothetical protein